MSDPAVRGTDGPFELDHNAATPVDPRVLDRFVAVERACPANPASPHAGGRRARAVLEEARAEAAAALDVPSDCVVFLATGTEANNLVVSGAGVLDRPVLMADVEHRSVLEPARRRGVVRWDVDTAGRALVRAPDREVGLVCLVHGQGEVGAVQPIAAAAAVARACGVPFHVDAAQTLGRLSLRSVLEVADTVTLSVHKAGGLRGASALVVRGAHPVPQQLGGGQEGGLRSGTPSPSLAAATALAIRLAVDETDARAAAMRAARDAFAWELDALERAVRLSSDDGLPNTAAYLFEAVDGRALLPALDLAGVRASQGSACSTGAPEPPAVVRAMGIDVERARGFVRFAFARDAEPAFARAAARRVMDVVLRLRSRAR